MKVDEYIDLKGSVITNPVNYYGKHFNNKVNFYRATFQSSAGFFGAQFDSSANFHLTIFQDYADFKTAKFKSDVSFLAATFNSDALFQGVTFEDFAGFNYAKFKSNVDFEVSEFNSKVYFRMVEFDSIARFYGVIFKSDVLIDGSTLPKYLSFRNITDIAKEIDLTGAHINPKYDTCYINLTGSSIEKFRFRYRRFKLWFPEEDSIDYELKASVYEDLLKKQRDEGFTKSYEILDKEYKEFQYIDSDSQYSWFWGHLLNWIDKNWWGYSYDKEKIIWNVLLIYLLISLINALMLRHLTTSVYINQNIKELYESDLQNGWYTKTINTLGYSLFYTAVIFFGFKFDMDKLNYKDNLKGWKRLNLIYFFTIYLGGFVCLAYLANYIITV